MNPNAPSYPQKGPNPFFFSGFSLFFNPPPLNLPELSVKGIGIREWIPPSAIERPKGTGDYLFMLFHEPAFISCSQGKDRIYPGDTMMIWPPGEGQFYGNRSTRFCHSWIHCEGSRVRQMIQRGGVPLRLPFAASNSFLFEQCLTEIHAELVAQIEPDPVIVGNLLENCLRAVVRSPESAKAAKIPKNLAGVHQLLLTGPGRKLTLNDLSKMAGMSAPYFCSVFTKTFGISPMDCLAKHRMYRASRLLRDTDLRIAQVALESGYEDPYHFSRLFKKYFNKNPRSFRLKADSSI